MSHITIHTYWNNSTVLFNILFLAPVVYNELLYALNTWCMFYCVFSKVGEDKDKRTKLHTAIRENFNNLESSTTEKDGQRYIKVCSSNAKHGYNKHKHARGKK